MNTKYCVTAFLAMFMAVSGAAAHPLYPNSVASNDLDFIHSDDPTVFSCFNYLGERRQEMPGHPSDELFANGVFTYDMFFEDGTQTEAWVHYDVCLLYTSPSPRDRG